MLYFFLPWVVLTAFWIFQLVILVDNGSSLEEKISAMFSSKFCKVLELEFFSFGIFKVLESEAAMIENFQTRKLLKIA